LTIITCYILGSSTLANRTNLARSQR